MNIPIPLLIGIIVLVLTIIILQFLYYRRDDIKMQMSRIHFEKMAKAINKAYQKAEKLPYSRSVIEGAIAGIMMAEHEIVEMAVEANSNFNVDKFLIASRKDIKAFK